MWKSAQEQGKLVVKNSRVSSQYTNKIHCVLYNAHSVTLSLCHAAFALKSLAHFDSTLLTHFYLKMPQTLRGRPVPFQPLTSPLSFPSLTVFWVFCSQSAWGTDWAPILLLHFHSWSDPFLALPLFRAGTQCLAVLCATWEPSSLALIPLTLEQKSLPCLSLSWIS